MQLEDIMQAHGLLGRGQSKPLPMITNFRGNSNDTGTQIILNWNNPNVIGFQKVQIFMSNTDISNMSYEELFSNGNMIVNSKVSTYTVSGLKHNDTRYFKAFGIFTILGEEKISSGVSVMVTTKDTVPPGIVTNLSVAEDDRKLTVSWSNPSDSDFDKVKIMYKAGSYPTSPTNGTVAYEGSGTSVVITGLVNDTKYHIRAFTYDKAGNINSSTTNQQITGTPFDSVDKTGSPGAKRLVAGTMQQGYFGTVSASELWTGTQLASAVGISQGTVQFDNINWLKFALDGKILFRPQKAFRHSISWDAINAAGCVYGTKTVSKNGHTYKVRLMKGANKDPAGDYEGKINHYSEWNKLMLPIHIEAKDKSWAYPDNVEADVPYWGIDFTDEDLQFGSGNGSGVWCQEVVESSSKRLDRGSLGVSRSISNNPSLTSTSLGWAPVLEFVA